MHPRRDCGCILKVHSNIGRRANACVTGHGSDRGKRRPTKPKRVRYQEVTIDRPKQIAIMGRSFECHRWMRPALHQLTWGLRYHRVWAAE